LSGLSGCGQNKRVIVEAMKLMIWVGILVGGTVGGLIGAVLDRGNMLGVWSIVLSTVGSLAGVWAGYKLGKAYF
jgi:uncharacterized protein YcfJ